MKTDYVKKILILMMVGILVFSGVGVVAITNNKATTITNSLATTDNYLPDAPESSEEILLYGTILYAFISGGPMGTGFYAFGPDDIIRFSEWAGGPYFTGGTWTHDGRWFCSMNGNGTLYEVNPKTFDAEAIGNGGVSLHGLSYDPVTEKLYGASTNALYEIDMETGEQEYIGDFGSDVIYMIAIAFDANGVLYGWDLGDYLWTIDTSTGDATQVGPLGININYACGGSFDFETDVLYFPAFTMSPSYGYFLFICDEDTGVCTPVGVLIGEYTVWTISYELNMEPPVTTAFFDPSEPNGDNGWYVSNVTVKLNATDNTGVIATYYRVDSGVWKEYDPVSSANITISEGGEHTIEYYSYDYVGNIEDVKSSTIYIDKTPPITSLEYEAWKEDFKWYVKLIFNVTDSTSGAGGKVEWSLNDVIQKIDEGPGPTYEWTIKWSPDYGHSSIIFKAATWDKAGNQANESIKGSDIKSHPRSQTFNTHQSSNMLFWEVLGIPILQKLLIWMVSV